MKAWLLIITTLFFISCNSPSLKKKKDNFDIGTLQGNIYSNNYFEFGLVIDTPWHIINESELTHLIEKRTEMLNEANEENFSIKKGHDVLLSMNIDTIENMPQVLFGSVDLKIYPQVKNEKVYLLGYFKQVKKLYENYDLQITSSEIGQESIGKKRFYTLLVTIKSANFLAYQKNYSLKIKDRLLNLMINYNSAIYLKECLKLLNKIKWE